MPIKPAAYLLSMTAKVYKYQQAPKKIPQYLPLFFRARYVMSILKGDKAMHVNMIKRIEESQ